MSKKRGVGGNLKKKNTGSECEKKDEGILDINFH